MKEEMIVKRTRVRNVEFKVSKFSKYGENLYLYERRGNSYKHKIFDNFDEALKCYRRAINREKCNLVNFSSNGGVLVWN